MGNRVQTITQRALKIEREFDEPLMDIVAGYSEMGYSIPRVAETLEVSVSSVKHYCARNRIRFSRHPIEHRDIRGRPPRNIQHQGTEKSLTEWAQNLGVSTSTIHRRLRRSGRPTR